MKILKYNESHNIAGRQIRFYRKQRGLTQEQVAAQMQTAGIQVDQKAISRIETGDRVITDYELMRLAEILSISVDKLMSTSIYDAENKDLK